jgi:hypothetical protein
VSGKRPYRGLSDAQANAEALERRDRPFTAAHQASASWRYDYRTREPRDLRDAVRQVRRAYADEVPARLHEGYDHIGEGGTPKMTARAEGYLFGHAEGSDRSDPEQLVSYYHTPFRALLASMSKGGATEQRIARVVSHIAIGGQGPKEAVIAEGVPSWAASLVVMPILSAFLSQLTDMKVHARVPNDEETVVSSTAVG